jgi:tRNA 2-selenouridine synthase
MSLASVDAAEAAADAGRFDAVIDVRSPAEFAEDHLPGALNWPVLDDEQRRIVGTLYKQVSTLQARKVGAAMVARNIASHLEHWVLDKPRTWQPLVYCWRGGQRSGTLAWFLGQIGFCTGRLTGGYKAWRAVVRTQLQTLPQRFEYRVQCGRTGSGKTRLLHALAQSGAQTLDLEGLARHRGSILGSVPGQPQPSQKRFDTLLWQALHGFDAQRPVFVEGESRKIGALRVPEALIQQLREQGKRRARRTRRIGAAGPAAARVRPLRGRCRRLLPAARRVGRTARARNREGLAGAVARRSLGRGVRGADAAAQRSVVRALAALELQAVRAVRAIGPARCRRSHAARRRAPPDGLRRPRA